MKVCERCKNKFKPKSKRGKYCSRKCNQLSHYYRHQKEKIEYQRRYYYRTFERDREKNKKRLKEWYKKNKEEHKDSVLKDYHRNKIKERGKPSV